MKPSLDLARRFRGLPRLAWAALFLAFVQFAAGEEYNKTNLLVRFDAEVQSAQRTNILNALGGATISQKYTLVPDLYLVTLPAGQQVDQVLSAYNATPGIRYAEPNYVVRVAATTPNDPRFSELWGLHNTGQTGGTPGADIRAPEAWDFNTGSREIIVAVIDTGVDYTHPDLTNNIWTNPGEIPGDGIDNDGNGYVDDV
ncbi:MAG TPA: S8 family serine peptidase, partial [Verrucomicrobiota bacterium]|nr:S8 family serine peptidase [Verrucomicrobiota bacterium]